MSFKVEKLLGQVANFEKLANDSLIAEAKKKEKKKDKEEKSKVKPHKEDKKDSKKNSKKASSYYDRLLFKFAQANTVLGDLGTARSSLSGMLAKLNELKADPGTYAPGNIDAAIDQINNALQQVGQAEREAGKGAASSQLDYYLGEIAKYYGYAKSYIKPNPGIWDTALDSALANASTNAKALPAAPAAPTSGTTPANNAAKPATTPAKPAGIPYRKDVEIAQQQLANMGGFDLGSSGRYGNGVDGKLGDRTRKALKQYNPNVGTEQAIKELVQKYNAGPELVKTEPEVPKEKTPAEKIQEQVEEVFPTPKPPVSTWGK